MWCYLVKFWTFWDIGSSCQRRVTKSSSLRLYLSDSVLLHSVYYSMTSHLMLPKRTEQFQSSFAFSTIIDLNHWNKCFLSYMVSAVYFVIAMGKVVLVFYLVSNLFIKWSYIYLIWDSLYCFVLWHDFTKDTGLSYCLMRLMVLTTYDDSDCMLFTNYTASKNIACIKK